MLAIQTAKKKEHPKSGPKIEGLMFSRVSSALKPCHAVRAVFDGEAERSQHADDVAQTISHIVQTCRMMTELRIHRHNRVP